MSFSKIIIMCDYYYYYYDQEWGNEAADAGGPRDQAQPQEWATLYVQSLH